MPHRDTSVAMKQAIISANHGTNSSRTIISLNQVFMIYQGVTDFRSSTQKIQEQNARNNTQYLMQDSKVERPSYNSKQETAGQGAGYSTQIPRY